MIVATFGDLILRVLVNDFQSFVLTQEYGYGVQEKLVRKPSLQSVGNGLAKIRFEFIFHRGLIDPELGILQFRNLAESKTPQGLVFGEVYKGQWVVSSIEEDVLKFELFEDEIFLKCVAHRVELLESPAIELRKDNNTVASLFGFLS